MNIEVFRLQLTFMKLRVINTDAASSGHFHTLHCYTIVMEHSEYVLRVL